MQMFTPSKIIVHHSLTKDNQTVSWGAIRRYHTSPPPDGPADGPYIDIGYHVGVEMVYTEYEIFFGRSWDIPGAHTRGVNQSSLGIVFVGDYDNFPPPEKMLDIASVLIKLWMKLFNITKDNIFGHRDFADYKSCPGKMFDMERLWKKLA